MHESKEAPCSSRGCPSYKDDPYPACRSSKTSIALRCVVKFHFQLGPENDDKEFYVAAHHWASLLISRNFEGLKGNGASRQFKNLLTRSEAGSYDCSMEEKIDTFKSCMKRARVLISRTDGVVIEVQDGVLLDAENGKKEVNRFLGWAIWSLRRKLSKRRNRAEAKDWVLVENVEPLIQHLDGMRCFHHHAIIDQEYMENCYSQADQSRNGAWLSLVSKK
jgi:hypothetical protein